jgi:hypothetical protein
MPAPTPSAITRGTLRARLSAALGSSTFWTSAELNGYINEALRMWSVAAAYWRERGTFVTAANTPFYDLTSQVPSLLGHAVTDQDLVTAMEYHLLEPPTPTVWTGTSMFTLSDLTLALQRRRDQFLGETGIFLTQYAPSAQPTPVGRVLMADSLLDVRRATWKTPEGVYSLLHREDERSFNAYLPGWNTNPDTPQAYSMITSPVWEMQLAPLPADKGTIDILGVFAGGDLNPAAGVLMGIPDDFAPYVKWGALADLLGFEGPARDPMRSAYCEQRWREGIQLARMSSTVLHAEIQGVVAPVLSVFDVDQSGSSWMNSAEQPSVVAMAGSNMLAVANVPDAIYSVTVDVVRKAPLPTDDTTALELSYDIADVVLGYAEHLAAFKMGGQEFEATMPMYQRIMLAAALNNDRLRSSAANYDVFAGTALREQKQKPRRASDVKLEPISYEN